MFSNKVEVLTMARALAAHAAGRQGIIAKNMANVDTPGFQAQGVTDFATVWQDRDFTPRQTRPQHLPGQSLVRVVARADSTSANPNGNSVSLEAQMVQSTLARQAHDMALAIQRSLGGVIRTTLARR